METVSLDSLTKEEIADEVVRRDKLLAARDAEIERLTKERDELDKLTDWQEEKIIRLEGEKFTALRENERLREEMNAVAILLSGRFVFTDMTQEQVKDYFRKQAIEGRGK